MTAQQDVMVEAFKALALVAGGGSVVGFFDHWLRHKEKKVEFGDALRDELHEELGKVKAEVAQLHTELDKWKTKYFELYKENARMMAELEVLTSELRNLRSKLLLYVETGRLTVGPKVQGTQIVHELFSLDKSTETKPDDQA